MDTCTPQLRTGSTYIGSADCDCGEIRLIPFKDRVLVICPCKAARWLNSDGTTEILEFPTISPITNTGHGV